MAQYSRLVISEGILESFRTDIQGPVDPGIERDINALQKRTVSIEVRSNSSGYPHVLWNLKRELLFRKELGDWTGQASHGLTKGICDLGLHY